MKIDKKIIKELTDYLNEFNLTELEYTEKDTKIRVMVVCPAQTDTPLMRFVDETDSADVIKSAVEKGMLCDPEEVVDQIEKDILTDKIICYPTKEAVYATRIRRFFPNYWWKLVAKNSWWLKYVRFKHISTW